MEFEDETCEKIGCCCNKSVSRKFTRFKSVSDEKLQELKEHKLKKQTYAKMMWGVNTYKEWRVNRLQKNFDLKIWQTDLDNVNGISVESFTYSLTRFLAEVTKAQDGSDYPGHTLYHLVISIQKFVNEQGKDWKLVDGREFCEVRTVLDNLMKDRASRNIGMVVKQVNYVSLDYENTLWDRGLLGEDTPEKLRNTVLFLLGINLGLHAGDEHYDLRRDTLEKPSQIQFMNDSNGIRCLVYKEDSVTKTNDSGIKHMRKQCKTVWVHPSDNFQRLPVRLVEKYISLCPAVSPKTKKFNFYLRSLDRCKPSRWYGEQFVGINNIRKVVQTLLKDAKLNGYFTNHSLRCSGMTRLFHKGVDRKLIKEFTGHSSDAMDNYQITSDEQNAEMSRIIQGQNECKQSENDNNVKMSKTSEIGKFLSEVLEVRKGRKATIKIELQFDD